MKIEKEIFVWGIARSGIHFVCDFILGHYYDKVPSLLHHKSSIQLENFCKSGLYLDNYFTDRKYEKWQKKYNWPEKSRRIPVPDSPISTQLISYENGGDAIQKDWTYNDMTDIINKPENIIVDTQRNVEKKAIVLLRDPFNWYSSWRRGVLVRDKDAELFKQTKDTTIEMWIRYAKTFFAQKLPVSFFPVNYNELCTNAEYRKKLSEFIGEEFTDAGANKVSSMGSSWSVHQMDGKGLEMETCSRWKELDEEARNDLRKYPQIFELSEEIFNFCPFK